MSNVREMLNQESKHVQDAVVSYSEITWCAILVFVGWRWSISLSNQFTVLNIVHT